ncbi:MAG: hypothetical protein ACI9G1_000569, partial [Pirellulaceae bacterium]
VDGLGIVANESRAAAVSEVMTPRTIALKEARLVLQVESLL